MSRTVKGVVTVDANEVVTFTNEVSGFVFDQSVDTTLTIAGVVNVTTNHSGLTIAFDIASGIHRPGNAITITSTGRVTVEAAGDSNGVVGLYAANGTPDLVNAGMFSIHGRVQARGVFTSDPSFNMTNSGVLRVRSDLKDATGVHAMSGATVANTGLIEVFGATTTVGIYSDGISNITNGGTIRAVSSGGRSAGIVVSHMAYEVSRITNTGLIEAENAIIDDSEAYSPPQDAVQIVTNSGQIRGIVDLGRGADQLVNTGSITGEVRLGRGADLYDSTGGTQSGGVYGGFGNDRMTGGAGNDVLFGEHDDDELTGGAGDDFLGGGRGSDSLDGGDGLDTVTYVDLTTGIDLDLAAGRAEGAGTDTLRNIENVYGSRWNDTLRGDAGANLLFGDAGADTIDGRAGNDVIVGGSGADVLTGGSGADTFVFGAGDGADAITDFKAGGEHDVLEIHGYSGYRSLTQTADGTLVVLSDTDSILLRGVSASSLTASDFSFTTAARSTYAAPGRTPDLLGSATWTVVTSEQVYQGETLRFVAATGGIAITRDQLGAAGYLTNYGTIEAVEDGSGANGTVSNPLWVTYSANGVGVTGPMSGGGFTNAAGGVVRVTTTSVVTGVASGFTTDGMASVLDNRGDIIVRGAYQAYGVQGLNFNLIVQNSGLIDVVAASTAYGMRLGQSGNATNTGVVSVEGSGTVVGIYGVSSSSIVNSGSIIAYNRTGASIGIQTTSDNVTITNSGLIEATTAIQASLYLFSGSATIRNTGELRGAVILGSGADTFTSSGKVTGAIDMGNGADTFDGSGATTAFTVNGGAGDDTLKGGAASDILDGGDGSDTVVFDGAFADYTLSLVNGVLTVTGAASGSDRLTNVEYLRFSDRTYTVESVTTPTTPPTQPPTTSINGTASSDLLSGTSGADVIQGLGGSDFLRGEEGNDVLDGGDGDDWLLGGPGNDTLTGGAGTDTAIFSIFRSSATVTYSNGTILVSGGDGQDTLINIEALSFLDGTYEVVNGTLQLFPRQAAGGTANNDTLTGTSANDLIRGMLGNDVLTGGGGSDLLDGGDGVDTAVYSGVRRQYGTSHGAVSGGPEGGTDTLVSIENLKFLDGTLTFDENSVAAEILRIYDATLDRGPDAFGLDGWLQARAGGTTLVQMANSFVNSDEFKARYGALDDNAFVSLLYNFCLNRNVDPLGLKSYTDLLKSGQWTRGDVVLSLSESVEHRQLMAPQLEQGLWVADQTTLTIARLYDATFDRLPDLYGLNAWRQEIAAGRSLNSMAAAFAGSVEFQDRYGALSNSDFVKLIYTYSLDRNVDPLGLKSYTDLLDSGQWTRADVLLSLSESTEHKQLTAALWYNGVQYQGYVAPSASPAETATKDHLDDAFVLPALDTDAAGGDADQGAAAIVLHKADLALTSPAQADALTLAVVLQDHATDAFVLPALDADAAGGDAALTLPNTLLDDLSLPGTDAAANTVGGYADHALTLVDDPAASILDDTPFWIRPHNHDAWV